VGKANRILSGRPDAGRIHLTAARSALCSSKLLAAQIPKKGRTNFHLPKNCRSTVKFSVDDESPDDLDSVNKGEPS
jgi:hypothetical protein